jgi:hypothetical protein
LNIEAIICGTVITLYMAGTTVQTAQTGGCALYVAPSLQYNAHSIADISPITAEILSAEY